MRRVRYKRTDSEIIEAAVVPLLEMFSVLDEVFGTEGAFDNANIHTSLGRLYREWIRIRTYFDPNFNSAKYRHDIGKRRKRSLPIKPRKDIHSHAKGFGFEQCSVFEG